MKSRHKIFVADARQLNGIEDESVECIVTSPPYPMIEMWDHVFSKLNPLIGNAFKENNGLIAFPIKGLSLEKTWSHISIMG